MLGQKVIWETQFYCNMLTEPFSKWISFIRNFSAVCSYSVEWVHTQTHTRTDVRTPTLPLSKSKPNDPSPHLTHWLTVSLLYIYCTVTLHLQSLSSLLLQLCVNWAEATFTWCIIHKVRPANYNRHLTNPPYKYVIPHPRPASLWYTHQSGELIDAAKTIGLILLKGALHWFYIILYSLLTLYNVFLRK